jgi:hypothetical protein
VNEQETGAYPKRRGETRNVYKDLSRAPERKGHHVRSRRRLEGNIYVSVIGDIDWVHVARDTDWWRGVFKTVINLLFLYNMRNFLAGWANVSNAIRHPHRCINIDLFTDTHVLVLGGNFAGCFLIRFIFVW